MAETLLKDIRYALRWLARSPGFSAVAILSLGLGVGFNTAMFSLVDSLLFRPLPVTAPHTLVDIFTSAGDGDEFATSSYQDYLDLKAQNTVFADVIGYSPMIAPLSLGDRSRVALGQVVTSNYFTVLGVQPLLGRMLVPADDEPGADRVVVLSHRMWQREFGGDPQIVGKSITLRGLTYSVAGVAPARFTGVVPLLTPELFLPVVHVDEVEPAGITDSVPSPTGNNALERRGTRWMFMKGRLKPGVTAAQAHANVALIGNQLAAAHVQTNKDRKMAALPTSEVRLLVPQAGGVLSVGAAALMSIVGLVLLIACANVAGMLLARASARRREISVRLAIGASRARLIQQLVVEGALLGILGAIAAVVLAWGLVQGLQTMPLPLPVNVAFDLRIDVRVLTFSLLIASASGMLAGLIPAFKASAPSLVSDLRGEAPAARLAGRRWALRDALVVTQVALTAVLLVVAGLLLRSLGASERADVGFDPKGLAAVAFDTDMVRYTPERGREFWRQAQLRVAALPGVSSAGIVSPTLPFTFNFNQQELRIDNRTYTEGQRGEIVENVAISADYLGTLGVPVIDGRGVDATDVAGSPDVAVINQTMARKFWPNESAVGHTFTAINGTRSRTYRIVGVARDHKRHGVLESDAPFVYYAEQQRPARYNFLIARTSGDAAALLQTMRRELLAMEPGLVFMGSNTMEENLALSLTPARVGAMLATAFGGLGTLLAAIGLYGVIAFAVTRRTREIGVRMALGAQPGGVMTMVMRQGLMIVAIGLVAGALLAAAAATALQGVLYGITPFDPLAWGLAMAAMILAAALANFVPARRAMRIDPITALRIE
jgi:macrolide transport system ATP-binding/permease protein